MIKPIPTKYRGINYRSRLEARWAVFLDEIGVKYHYELEGFELESTWYLPDFFLPERNTWIEIKPQRPSKEEWLKAASLLSGLIKTGSEASVAILYGRPWVDEERIEYCYLNLYPEIGRHYFGKSEEEYTDVTLENITIDHISDDEMIFVQCRRCEQITLDSLGMHYPELSRDGYCGIHGCCDRESATIHNSDFLIKAYQIATEKRFY